MDDEALRVAGEYFKSKKLIACFESQIDRFFRQMDEIQKHYEAAKDDDDSFGWGDRHGPQSTVRAVGVHIRDLKETVPEADLNKVTDLLEEYDRAKQLFKGHKDYLNRMGYPTD